MDNLVIARRCSKCRELWKEEHLTYVPSAIAGMAGAKYCPGCYATVEYRIGEWRQAVLRALRGDDANGASND